MTDPPSPTGSSRTNLVSLLTMIYVKPLHKITGACARMRGRGEGARDSRSLRMRLYMEASNHTRRTKIAARERTTTESSRSRPAWYTFRPRSRVPVVAAQGRFVLFVEGEATIQT